MKENRSLDTPVDVAVAYPENTLMKDRFPMATPAEMRDDVFAPVVRFAPGVDASKRSRELVFTDKEGRITGRLTVTGPAREIHRCFLDFLLAFCKPFLVDAGPLGVVPVFFMRKYKVAKALFADGGRTERVDAIVDELKSVRVSYVRGDRTADNVFDSNPLVLFTGTLTHLRAAGRLGSIEEGLRDLLKKRGARDVAEFEDLTMVVLAPDYLDCFRDQSAIRYHDHVLDILSLESPVARQLVRFALSHDFVPDTPLRSILATLGVAEGNPDGRSMRRAISLLLDPQTRGQLQAAGVQLIEKDDEVVVRAKRDTNRSRTFASLEELLRRKAAANNAAPSPKGRAEFRLVK